MIIRNLALLSCLKNNGAKIAIKRQKTSIFAVKNQSCTKSAPRRCAIRINIVFILFYINPFIHANQHTHSQIYKLRAIYTELISALYYDRNICKYVVILRMKERYTIIFSFRVSIDY